MPGSERQDEAGNADAGRRASRAPNSSGRAGSQRYGSLRAGRRLAFAAAVSAIWHLASARPTAGVLEPAAAPIGLGRVDIVLMHNGNAMNPSEPQSPLPRRPVDSDQRRHRGEARAVRLRNYFLTGLVVAGPLAITLYITWWFVTWVDGWVKPLVPDGLSARNLPAVPDPGLRPRHRLHRPDAARLPHRKPRRQDAPRTSASRLEPHAGGARHLQGHEAGLRDDLLRERHLVPHGRPRPVPGEGHLVDRLHLDAGRPRHGRAAAAGRANIVGVFLPCTPNPTTGFFFYLPRRDVIELPMSVDDAAKLVMSAGVIQPDETQAGCRRSRTRERTDPRQASRREPSSRAASLPARSRTAASRSNR